MRALKILVVVMGVVLVLGTVALVVALVARGPRPSPQATSAAAGRTAASRVDLPAGGHILSTQLAGDRVLVRVGLPDGSEEEMLFDARSGARVAVIEFHVGSPGAATGP